MPNSWSLEHCFGWRGVLVEGHPLVFSQLARNRPGALTMRRNALRVAADKLDFEKARLILHKLGEEMSGQEGGTA